MKIRSSQTESLILKELGRRLEAERLQRNLPQSELAAAAGLSRRTVIRMERGDACRLDAFLAVLKRLGIVERLDAVLPEPGLTPIQEARLAAVRASLPRRSRASQGAKPASASRRWGDGVPVGAKDGRTTKGGAR